MENVQEELRRSHRTASVIGIAIIASLFVYLVVVEVVRATMGPFRGFVSLPGMATLRYVFYGLAVIEVLTTRLLQGILLRRASGDDVRTTVLKLARTAVVTLSLSEVPALLGLVLFLLGGLNKDFYALLAVSLVLAFMYFPRLGSWENWVERKA
jgi:hypothetical protein